MFIGETDIHRVADALEAQQPAQDEVLCLLMAEQDADPEGLMRLMRERGHRCCGAVFPGLLAQGHLHAKGVFSTVLRQALPPVLVPHLDLSGMNDWLGNLLELAQQQPVTLLIFLDGLAQGVGTMLDQLYDHLGDRLNYLGGGAGMSDLAPHPCIFTEEGAQQGAALLAPVAHACSLGVRHGWHRLHGPYIVTRAHGNWIEELNWTPAFDVYAAALANELGTTPTRQQFPEVAMHYPFGMLREGNEDIVRDPIAVNEHGAIRVISEVPQNAVLHILHGTSESLITSAEQAAAEGLAHDYRTRQCLIMDCISRSLCLGEDFERETQSIRRILQTKPASQDCGGALTLGEISSNGRGVLEFFNKTIVVGTLYDTQ